MTGARDYFARSAAIFEEAGNDVEIARTLKAFARFLLKTEARSDADARREALAMEHAGRGRS